MRWATDRSKGRPCGAVAFLVEIHRESIFWFIYAFPEVSYGGEVIVRQVGQMYVTIEVLFVFCALIIDLLALVILIFQNNKKK